MSDFPRYLFVLRCNADGSLVANVDAFAAGVTKFDIARALAGSLPDLLANPNSVFPTQDELAARQVEADLVANAPAVMIYGSPTSAGAVFLCRDAIHAIGADLAARGWSAIPLPDGISRGCDYTRDPAEFNAKYLADPVGNATAEA